LFAPQGWWHYAVALDASVTVMRNFFSKANKHELTRRKDEALGDAVALNVLRAQPKLRKQTDEVLKTIGRRTVAKIRETMAQNASKPGATTWQRRLPRQ